MVTRELTAFVQLPLSRKHSAEFALCIDMLRAALPSDTEWIVHDESDPLSVRDVFLRHLPFLSQFVLFVRDPAVLFDKKTFAAMRQVLEKNSALTSVLPSDLRGFRQGRVMCYYTLRGFEIFVDSLQEPEDLTENYDGREPWAFLARSKDLQNLTWPNDIFDLPKVLPAEKSGIALNAYIHPFFNYYQETRLDVLPHVPLDIRSLLDVGCARGGFGEAVKVARGCHVAGVEMNAHEAALARQVIDQVWEGDFLSLTIDEKFDCISVLDVIEHFPAPRLFLEKVKTLLNPGGKVLFSVPNVGHWSVVEDLLAGRWDYVPAGILCNTHLRFFTESSIRSLFKESGFSRVDLQHQRTPIPEELEKRFLELCKHGVNVDLSSLSTIGFIGQASANP